MLHNSEVMSTFSNLFLRLLKFEILQNRKISRGGSKRNQRDLDHSGELSSLDFSINIYSQTSDGSLSSAKKQKTTETHVLESASVSSFAYDCSKNASSSYTPIPGIPYILILLVLNYEFPVTCT